MSAQRVEFCELDSNPELDLGQDRGELRIIDDRTMLFCQVAQLLELGARQFTRQERKAEIFKPVEQPFAASRGAATAIQVLSDFLKHEEPTDRRRCGRGRRRSCLLLVG